MNLWHQRLIIAVAKFFAVILGLLFVGYFLYYNLYFKQDALIKYVPKDAIAYATFRITAESEQNEILSKIKEEFYANNYIGGIDWDIFNQLVGNNLSLAVFANDINIPDYFDYLVLVNIGPRKNISREYLNFIQQSGWNYHFFTNKTKSQNILAIASSDKLLKKVKTVAIKQDPSLAQKVNIVLNLKLYSPDNFWGRLYIDKSYFTNYAVNFIEPQIKLVFTSLATMSNDQIFLGFLKTRANKIIVQTNSRQLNLNSDNASYYPPGMEYCVNFYDLAHSWIKITNILKDSDVVYYNKLSENIKYYEGVYNFNLNIDILPLLKQEVHLIKVIGDKFILSLKLDGQDIDEQIMGIENIIKTFLATSYPVERQKQLPDYTYITQIARELKEINFIAEEAADKIINALSYKNQEFVYVVKENVIFLANSRQFILDYLSNNDMNQCLDDIDYNNFTTNFSQNLHINLNNFMINNDLNKIFTALDIRQDIDTNEILLILE